MPTATCQSRGGAHDRSAQHARGQLCRRYGALWAFDKASTVRLKAGPKATRAYAWGRKGIRFLRCATCGCVMCWAWVSPKPERTMGVNACNFEPEILAWCAGGMRTGC
jgi:hypothetical protein